MPMTTAAQQRATAKVEYDAFLATCPSRMLLDRISDKWVGLVLCALGDAPRDPATGSAVLRYSELGRRLAGVSPKMLSQTLRALERDGLVTRTATPTVPVTVTYELTDLGHSLRGALRVVKEWAEGHMDDVLAHREAYDVGMR
ncbi:helix-turn-helix transcriptional regulator [Cellulomonas sp. Sa3CUA2]|uniref:Helix-turn-helix transcriptional regulator n=1 Tax=Cellulomonas avistercoris TaxID=2762242 RepID=A0ABR8QH93_9CELL|nr:helix-turn-helix domain-containing protein [Cellulomonas avistercoris]MBD7919796.1 helix-turn-helix transcriptional regulator [Cellulomonas avistercoris]